MSEFWAFLCMVFYEPLFAGNSRRRWGEAPHLADWRRLCQRLRANFVRMMAFGMGWLFAISLVSPQTYPALASGVGGMLGVFSTFLGWGAVILAVIFAVQLAYAYLRAHQLGGA